jgi:hypothetical protein
MKGTKISLRNEKVSMCSVRDEKRDVRFFVDWIGVTAAIQRVLMTSCYCCVCIEIVWMIDFLFFVLDRSK